MAGSAACRVVQLGGCRQRQRRIAIAEWFFFIIGTFGATHLLWRARLSHSNYFTMSYEYVRAPCGR